MSEEEQESQWEHIDNQLWRIKAEGGYIYQSVVHGGNESSTALCFVPDVDLERYASHLRDAYNQGFKDGQEELKEAIT